MHSSFVKGHRFVVSSHGRNRNKHDECKDCVNLETEKKPNGFSAGEAAHRAAPRTMLLGHLSRPVLLAETGFLDRQMAPVAGSYLSLRIDREL